MSDASRVRLTISSETAFAEDIPGTLSQQQLRIVSENLRHASATVVSAELRSDRSRSDLLPTGFDVAGDINTELSFGSFDDYIAAALCSDWATNVLKNGTTRKSFLIERGLMDVNQFFQYQGCMFNGWHLDVSARAIIRQTFNVMGAKSPDPNPTQTSAVDTVTPPTTSTVMSSGPVVSGIESNTNMTGVKATRVSLDLMNNLRARPDVESYYSAAYGMGVQDVTGQIVFYFETEDIYQAYIGNDSQAFSFVLHDPDTPTKTYTILLPKIKFTDIDVNTPGVDQDIIATVGYRALFDAVSSAHIQITRVTS